jgi:beta-xylosidase
MARLGARDRAGMSAARREVLAGLGGLGLASAFPSGGMAAAPAQPPRASHGRGFDNQRIPDQGDGTFLNPVVSGDRPDPAILKDGEDYYLTFSTFDAYPGLTIWHSRDLVNWRPLKAALTRNIGSVWAPSLHKHRGRYLLYIPVKASPANDIFVIHADHIEGPWSDPVALGLPAHIDPCLAESEEDDSVWLFLSGGDRVRLTDDGLTLAGAVEHVYDPWRYPADWVVEGFSPEGPKIHRIGEWYYMITAVGGTAGPPTGHMVIAARARSLHGPWEDHPGNPLVCTTSVAEAWWSRGHASLVEAPDGSWWSLYHGYENGFWTLGRQCLLDPVAFTPDGWFRMTGGDLSQPLAKPGGGEAVPHGMALSDDFSVPLALGSKWAWFRPAPDEAARIRIADGALHLAGKGEAPSSGSPLLLTAGDRSYAFECDIEVAPGGTAGLVLFYDDKLYCGLGFDAQRFVTHQYGIERGRPANPHGRRMRIRVTNREHIVTFDTSGDGGQRWVRFDRGMEVSGYHHNVRGGFLMLRPGLYAAGPGEAAFRDFRFTALDD